MPSFDFYPDFKRALFKDYIFNDTSDRIKWRTKQNLDISYLMSYCHGRSEYYLQVLVLFNFSSQVFRKEIELRDF